MKITHIITIVVYIILALMTSLFITKQIVFAIIVSVAVAWPIIINEFFRIIFPNWKESILLKSSSILGCLISLVAFWTIGIIAKDALFHMWSLFIGICYFPFFVCVWIMQILNRIRHSNGV